MLNKIYENFFLEEITLAHEIFKRLTGGIKVK